MVGAGQYEASLRVAGPNDLELVPLHSGPVFHLFSYCFSAAALALVVLAEVFPAAEATGREFCADIFVGSCCGFVSLVWCESCKIEEFIGC